MIYFMASISHIKRISILKIKYKAIKSCLNEKGKRLWAAVETTAYGRGGFNAVCIATGLSTATLAKGIRDLQKGSYSKTERVREVGGGRKKLSHKYPALLDALEKISGIDIALVLTDWNMPEMNGEELVRALRADPKYSSVPILMVTTRGMKEDVMTAVKLGVNGYVVKPFTPDILKKKLQAIL